MKRYGFRTVALLPDATGQYRTQATRCAEGMTREGAEDAARMHAGPLPYTVAEFETAAGWEAYPGTGYATRPDASAPWHRAPWVPLA